MRSPFSLSRALPSLIVLGTFTLSCLGQDQSSSPRVLTLSQAISIALEDNISLQRSALSVETRETSVEQAEANYDPDLNARVSENIGLSGNNQGGIFEGEGNWNDTTSASLSSSLTLYNGGARDAALARARSELEAASRDFDRDRQTLLFDTVALFFQTVLRAREIAIQEEELATRREELERIQVRIDNGIRIETDGLRQKALVANNERSLAQARNNYANSLYTLKRTLRIPPSANILCEDPAPGLKGIDSIPETNLNTSLTTLESRYDLAAQYARVDSAKHDLTIAQAGKSPTISASASLSTNYSSNANPSFSDQFLIDNPRAAAGISVNIPIFDRSRKKLDTLRSKIFLDQEELALENLQLIARTALFQADQNYQTAKLQLAASVDQLASTEAALEAEVSRYEAGAATLLDVNSLRSSRLDAAVAVEESRFDLFTSRLAVSYQDGTIESFLQQTLEITTP
ncbi:TolC family protein [Pelagicoccus mobilis]|uniref:TolC family protein n=1 Tax=Pelagicoccus mobilis TaxID=415221 RepID=A0A934S167_9BACT|nr:TolC family protein [Pelagicoccus mobilis]MBK1878701.1 TolC family protein [Pelagicoccus mobilis]